MKTTSLLLFLHSSLFAVPAILLFHPPDIYGLGPVLRYLQVAVPVFLAWGAADRLLSRRQTPVPRSITEVASGGVRPVRRACRRLSRPAKVLVWGVSAALAVTLLKISGGFSLLFGLLTQPIFMAGIFFALAPAGLFAAAGLVFASLLAARRIRPSGFLRRGWVLCLYGCWLTACVSLGFFHAFKVGPPDTVCEQVSRSPGVIPLYGIASIREAEGLSGSMPYDLAADPGAGVLFVSIKRTDGLRGAIAKVDLSGKTPVSMLQIDEKMPGVRLFPERMAVDPVKQEVYTLLLGSPRHKLHAASYRNGAWMQERVLPLEGEPNHIFLDREQGTLVVLFAGSDTDGLTAFRTETWEEIRRIGSDRITGCSQFAALDRAHGRFYFTNIGFSPLYEADEALQGILRKNSLGLPLVGMAVRQEPHLLYVSSPMSRDVRIVDPESLAYVGAIRTNGGLAKIEIDEARGRLYVADYGGNLSVYSLDEHRLLERLFLGRMLRSIHLDQDTGRIFACSGCGVFEIVTELPVGGSRDLNGFTR